MVGNARRVGATTAIRRLGCAIAQAYQVTFSIAGVTGRVFVGANDISNACIGLTRDAYRDS